MLAVTSDKGTCHCFHIGAKAEEKKENTKSFFSALSSISTFFESEWGFSSFKFSDSLRIPVTKVAFISDDVIVLISLSGDYYKLKVKIDTNEIEVEEHTKFYEG